MISKYNNYIFFEMLNCLDIWAKQENIKKDIDTKRVIAKKRFFHGDHKNRPYL